VKPPLQTAQTAALAAEPEILRIAPPRVQGARGREARAVRGKDADAPGLLQEVLGLIEGKAAEKK
jgi:hypothetical protein